MKLVDARQAYYDHSGKASDVARALAFAGIALIWIFKIEDEGGPHIPAELLLPAALLAISLACDLLQYISLTLAWGIYHRVKEKAGTKAGTEFQAPNVLNWPGLVFFWGKLFSVAWGFLLLVGYTLDRLPMVRP